LATSQIPDLPAAETAGYLWRPATISDVAVLERLYAAAMAQHQLFVARSDAAWRYLLQHKGHPVRLLEEVQSSRAVGYVVPSRAQSPCRLYEHAVENPVVGLHMLALLKAECGGELQLAGPASDRLVQLALSLGGMALPVADQWLWRIPNVGGLLHKLTPRLARRVRATGYGDYTGSLCLNLYRHAFRLAFNRGAITVEPAGFVDASLGAAGGDLDIPPDAFVRLLLGYGTLDQLTDAWPDLRIKPAARHLVEVLFPPLTAHVLMPY
jgi:hypothetical protein